MNLKINHRLGVENVEFFNNFNISLKHDSVASTFGFRLYFDPKNKKHAETICLSHFHEAILQHNNQTLITGYILGNKLKRNAVKNLVEITGYSKPGILEDSTMPHDLYPLEKDGLTLQQIAQEIASYFKLKVIVDSSVTTAMNTAIEKTTASPTQTIKDYLTELATQRHIIISHDNNGNLLFTREKTKRAPIAFFEDGIPSVNIELDFAGQGIHSPITVVKQADSDGGNAGEYSINNPYCPIINRPKTVTQTSGTDLTTQEFARQVLANEIKSCVRLKIDIDRWDINSDLILPRNVISVKSKENFLYKETNWFIEQVDYAGDEKQMTAALHCVPEAVYNDDKVTNIFVDPHENFPRNI